MIALCAIAVASRRLTLASCSSGGGGSGAPGPSAGDQAAIGTFAAGMALDQLFLEDEEAGRELATALVEALLTSDSAAAIERAVNEIRILVELVPTADRAYYEKRLRAALDGVERLALPLDELRETALQCVLRAADSEHWPAMRSVLEGRVLGTLQLDKPLSAVTLNDLAERMFDESTVSEFEAALAIENPVARARALIAIVTGSLTDLAEMGTEPDEGRDEWEREFRRRQYRLRCLTPIIAYYGRERELQPHGEAIGAIVDYLEGAGREIGRLRLRAAVEPGYQLLDHALYQGGTSGSSQDAEAQFLGTVLGVVNVIGAAVGVVDQVIDLFDGGDGGEPNWEKVVSELFGELETGFQGLTQLGEDTQASLTRRFDQVDKDLSQIEDDLQSGFQLTSVKLDRVLETLNQGFGEVRAGLDAMRTDMERGRDELARQVDAVSDELRDDVRDSMESIWSAALGHFDALLLSDQEAARIELQASIDEALAGGGAEVFASARRRLVEYATSGVFNPFDGDPAPENELVALVLRDRSAPTHGAIAEAGALSQGGRALEAFVPGAVRPPPYNPAFLAIVGRELVDAVRVREEAFSTPRDRESFGLPVLAALQEGRARTLSMLAELFDGALDEARRVAEPATWELADEVLGSGLLQPVFDEDPEGHLASLWSGDEFDANYGVARVPILDEDDLGLEVGTGPFTYEYKNVDWVHRGGPDAFRYGARSGLFSFDYVKRTGGDTVFDVHWSVPVWAGDDDMLGPLDGAFVARVRLATTAEGMRAKLEDAGGAGSAAEWYSMLAPVVDVFVPLAREQTLEQIEESEPHAFEASRTYLSCLAGVRFVLQQLQVNCAEDGEVRSVVNETLDLGGMLGENVAGLVADATSENAWKLASNRWVAEHVRHLGIAAKLPDGLAYVDEALDNLKAMNDRLDERLRERVEPLFQGQLRFITDDVQGALERWIETGR